MTNRSSITILASLSYFVVSSIARAETPAPPLAPPTTSVDAAAGAHGEETYFPGPGGGEPETQGPPPLESTGLEDGPGSCKCSSVLGSNSSSNAGWAWFGLGLGAVAVWRRRPSKVACDLLQK